ncbi:conjugal transfer protein TraG, partial [Escherichia coli]
MSRLPVGINATRQIAAAQQEMSREASNRAESALHGFSSSIAISNEQATRELASRSTNASLGLYGDAYAKGHLGISVLGNGGGVGLQAGAKASIDGSDLDSHEASSGSRASHDARHDIDARATQDFKEASDYFTSRKVSES